MTIEGQADVLTGVRSLPILGSDVSCPHGVVVLSQTCDVVRADPPHITLARVVRIDDDAARETRKGNRPRYVHIPGLGDHHFADLDIVAVASKPDLATQPNEPGVSTDLEIRTFGAAVARRFGRFAFPDEVGRFLEPLRKVMQSKVGNPRSPLGVVLDEVVELRIEAAVSTPRED